MDLAAPTRVEEWRHADQAEVKLETEPDQFNGQWPKTV